MKNDRINKLEKKLNDLIQDHYCLKGMHVFEYHSSNDFEWHEGGMVTMKTNIGMISIDEEKGYEVYKYCTHCKIAFGITKKTDSSDNRVNCGYAKILRESTHK